MGSKSSDDWLEVLDKLNSEYLGEIEEEAQTIEFGGILWTVTPLRPPIGFPGQIELIPEFTDGQ